MCAIPKNNNRYLLQASYSYTINDQIFENKEKLSRSFYRNAWACAYATKEKPNQKYFVWYSSKHPQKAQLNKYFPYKLCFSTSLLMVILFYFTYISKKVAIMNK